MAHLSDTPDLAAAAGAILEATAGQTGAPAHAEPAGAAADARRARLATPLDAQGVGALVRHPADGWTLAEPWPLSKGTRRALGAIAVAMMPPPPAPQIPPERLLDILSVMMRYFPAPMAHGFPWAVRLVDWSPLWRFKGLRRLRSLPRERAGELLTQMAHSRSSLIRALLTAVRGAVMAMYFDQPEVCEALGFAPKPFMTARIALRQRVVAGATPGPEDRIGPYSQAVEP